MYQPGITRARYAGPMKRVLLLACLTLGPVAATPLRVSDPPPRPGLNGPRVTPASMQQARPTLDLLLTVRLLADLTRRGTLTPDALARAELRAALEPLKARPTLGPLAAQRTLDRVVAALTDPQRVALGAARADLERRANLLLSRARFATPDGPSNVALNRSGFMLPGGLPLVRRVVTTPDLNPYAEAGANAALLERLLTALDR